MAVEQRDIRSGGSGCPDTEDLAGYLDGTLDPTTRQTVESHLVGCARCRMALAETMAFLEDERAAMALAPAPVSAPARETHPRVLPFRAAIGVLAAAAVLILVARIAPQWMPWGPRENSDPARILIAALANERTRPVEARLMGGFPYAPALPVSRGVGRHDVSPELREAVATIDAQSSRDSGGHEGVGLAHLATGDVAVAVTELETAAAADPHSARLQNNLAAAYLARADALGSREDLDRALASADRALQISPRAPEALFNRALALHKLGDPRAVAAWHTALQEETQTAWRDEISQRLNQR
jgi:tetratricopeptide (TPR) repeat protein